jgi:flagellar biosynthesis/type III secretory pathway M-ring protein FliF/YscJ
MEPATILVLVLCVGVVALLVWFEINSRRNEARKKQMSTLAQPEPSPLRKKAQSKAESEIDKAKTA